MGIKKLAEGYYRTDNGRADIEYIEKGDVWKIFSCNGDFKGYAKTLEEAKQEAFKV